jgi:hypothetical protein
MGGARGWPEFDETGGAPGRGRGRARPRAHLGSGSGRSWSRGVVGEGVGLRSAVTAAAARVDGEDDSWLGNARVLEPLQGLGKGGRWLVGSGTHGRSSSVKGRNGGRRLGARPRGSNGAFYRLRARPVLMAR